MASTYASLHALDRSGIATALHNRPLPDEQRHHLLHVVAQPDWESMICGDGEGASRARSHRDPTRRRGETPRTFECASSPALKEVIALGAYQPSACRVYPRPP